MLEMALLSNCTGLGRIMTRALTENGASKVFILGRRVDALQETVSLSPEGTVIPIQCDVTSKESLDAAYEAVAAQTSHIDILFANSGVMGPKMPSPQPKADGSLPSIEEVRNQLYNVPMSEFNNVMDVNVTGALWTVLAFLPLLDVANKHRPAPQAGVPSTPTPQVIFTGSIAGFNRKPPFSYAYNISKAAVHHLTKMMSTTFVSYDIRFNGIAPGLYYSELADHVFRDYGVDGSNSTSDNSMPRELIPLGRAGSEQDFAGMIIWLASNSGGFLNGNIVVTDGGRISTIPATY